MIDINNLKIVFDEYISNYDSSNEKIKLKHEHTYRVCEMCKYICENLRLNKEDTELAYLIALLHDIGRFEQIKNYDSYSDLKTVDHALLGCNILFKDGLIRKFIKDDKYDYLIERAIYNHNKLDIEDNLDEKTLLHSKIIRDADKLDIFNIILNIGTIKLEPDNSLIYKKIDERFMNEKCIVHSDEKSKNDIVLSIMSYAFDLYFDCSFKYIEEHKYVESFASRLKDYRIFDKYIKILRNYVERKCKNARN